MTPVLTSDWVLAIGAMMTDFNTGAFTSRLDPEKTIDICHHRTQVGPEVYPNVEMKDILAALTGQVTTRRGKSPTQPGSLGPGVGSGSDPITLDGRPRIGYPGEGAGDFLFRVTRRKTKGLWLHVWYTRELSPQLPNCRRLGGQALRTSKDLHCPQRLEKRAAGPAGFRDAQMTEVTQNLAAIEQVDPHAAERLLPLVYHELRRLTAANLARGAGFCGRWGSCPDRREEKRPPPRGLWYAVRV